eukprot:gene23114-29466_t
MATTYAGNSSNVAFVKNGLSGTFYVDGQPAGTITATRDIHYDSNIIIIGEQSGPFPF